MKPVSILVTDDESNIRMTLRTALESDGYQVQEASDGREALSAIAANPPDLMVLDLNMPVIDGIGVLQEMKELAMTTRPKVIILTAYGSLRTAVKATRLGAVDFLEKPITPVELRQSVRSVLNETDLDALPRSAMEIAGAYEQALARVRRALRLAEYDDAESLLTRAAERKNTSEAEYFNLLGVLYEAQQKWRLARKCYTRAIAADKRSKPAQGNLRRIYELRTFGRSAQPILLGDEADDIWYARLPGAQR